MTNLCWDAREWIREHQAFMRLVSYQPVHCAVFVSVCVCLFVWMECDN